MSVREGGKFILCDGAGCQATAVMPVALQPKLMEDSSDGRTTEGWLYVVGNGKDQHFCPACTRQRLKALLSAIKPAKQGNISSD